jgi:hypothetical protein
MAEWRERSHAHMHAAQSTHPRTGRQGPAQTMHITLYCIAVRRRLPCTCCLLPPEGGAATTPTWLPPQLPRVETMHQSGC